MQCFEEEIKKHDLQTYGIVLLPIVTVGLVFPIAFLSLLVLVYPFGISLIRAFRNYRNKEGYIGMF
jgi:hypothetical protein